MKLITISGLDGSGKSTQINMLKTYLESNGKKVFYFHAVEHSLAQKLVNFKRNCVVCSLASRKNKPEESVVRANAFQIFLRKMFLRFDIWQFRKLYERLEKQGYEYILSDRYFYDSIINIEYLSKKNNWTLEVQPPDLSFYLQIPPEIIMQRERVPDQGLEYLKQKKELYDTGASLWILKIINGNRDKNEIFEEIKSFVK